MFRKKRIVDLPGDPDDQKNRPFINVSRDAVALAGYLGLPNTQDLLTYVTSDRFRVLFGCYRSWIEERSITPEFNIKEVL